MAGVSTNFDAIYPAPEKAIGTRRWIEMVGVLHRLGFGKLRLACSWENAGPAPVWFGVVAPGSYFRRDHGAILARHPFPEKERAAWEAIRPNDAPMFSSRRCGSRPDHHPWSGFLSGSAETAADRWIELYPQLAAEGRGEDTPYVAWYDRMLRTTAPTGLISAYNFWEPLPGYMYVSCGPAGLDRFELPPPGSAEEVEPSAVVDNSPGPVAAEQSHSAEDVTIKIDWSYFDVPGGEEVWPMRRLILRLCGSSLCGLFFVSVGLAALWGLVRGVTFFPQEAEVASNRVISGLLIIAVASFFIWCAIHFLSDAFSTIRDFWLRPMTRIGQVIGKNMERGAECPTFYLSLSAGSERFEVSATQYSAVNEGDQASVTYWPNSLTVEHVERIDGRQNGPVTRGETEESVVEESVERHVSDSPPETSTSNCEPIRRLMFMVHELHKLGYERLRLIPKLSGAGFHWRATIAPVSDVSRIHGARLILRSKSPVHYSTDYILADATADYLWTGPTAESADQLAVSFLAAYPEIASQGLGSDPDYARWYAEMLALTAPNGFIYAKASFPLPTDSVPTINAPAEAKVALPPPGEASESCPVNFSEGFRQRLALGKYSRWAVDLTEQQLETLIWAIGEYSVRAGLVQGLMKEHERELSDQGGAAFARVRLALKIIANVVDRERPDLETYRVRVGEALASIERVRESVSMTESEWLDGIDPQAMLEFLNDRASERKLRLFSVACCRRVWDSMDGEVYRKAVETATNYADGNATDEELTNAWRGARETYKRCVEGHHASAAAVSAACPPQDTPIPRQKHLLLAAIRAATAAQDLGAGFPDEGERKAQAALVHEIFGNPFRPVSIEPSWLAWNDHMVQRIAKSIYDGGRFDNMSVLADALEDAGCTNPDLVGHCRHPGEHVRGCFVVDLLLGK